MRVILGPNSKLGVRQLGFIRVEVRQHVAFGAEDERWAQLGRSVDYS
jgi:hypothetical protein